jgi:hypothetical protein
MSQTWCDDCEEPVSFETKRYYLNEWSTDHVIVCPKCAEKRDNHDPTPYCAYCGPKSACKCNAEND